MNSGRRGARRVAGRPHSGPRARWAVGGQGARSVPFVEGRQCRRGGSLRHCLPRHGPDGAIRSPRPGFSGIPNFWLWIGGDRHGQRGRRQRQLSDQCVPVAGPRPQPAPPGGRAAPARTARRGRATARPAPARPAGTGALHAPGSAGPGPRPPPRAGRDRGHRQLTAAGHRGREPRRTHRSPAVRAAQPSAREPRKRASRSPVPATRSTNDSISGWNHSGVYWSRPRRKRLPQPDASGRGARTAPATGSPSPMCPARREPFTPYRLITALREAGFGPDPAAQPVLQAVPRPAPGGRHAVDLRHRRAGTVPVGQRLGRGVPQGAGPARRG